MKKIIYIVCFLFMVLIMGCTGTIVKENYHPNPTFQALDNYGTWINDSELGLVWKPYDETNWQPYYDGHWIWTDSGWMWVGNEPYGWIVYHYGYWVYDDYYGWVWIPNYDWAPARVRWYSSNGYIGWAPLPPPGVRTRINFNKDYAHRAWVVVKERNFIDRNIGKYRTRDVEPGIERIRNDNGSRSPDLKNIERASDRRIEPVKPIREDVNTGSRRIIRVRIPEQSGRNQIERNRPPENNTLVPKPPTVRTPRPEPAKPPKPEVKKNNPEQPAKPARPERIKKTENGRNDNNIRNEGRKEDRGKKPETINRNNNKRNEKNIKKDEKKVEKKNGKQVDKKEMKKENREVKKKREEPKKERNN